ncbi:hypothetical protein [Lacticaseibacillus jixiensis]|jgi:hypothetical protein|uniref:hypothetical protein n=1 Tax=Lacticaseibacillus TaxID=2759736 RepID=UPI0036F3D649
MNTILVKRTYDWQYRFFDQRERLADTASQIMEDFGLYVAPTWLALKRSDEVHGELHSLNRDNDHVPHIVAGLEMQLLGNKLTVKRVTD